MENIDFQLSSDGDLYITPTGDICETSSICQAVRIRLLWFLNEWRLGPSLGFPYFEEVFVKNYNVTKIKYHIRNTVLSVEGVTNVTDIDFSFNTKTRAATISVTFQAGDEAFREEVEINGKIRANT